MVLISFFFFKQKTAYEMRISDWSSDVCSSDLAPPASPRNASPASKAWRIGNPMCRRTATIRGTGGYRSRWRGGMERGRAHLELKIGRASCRERVCQYV